jgi:hypothetical protein
LILFSFVPQAAAEGFAAALEEASPFFSKEQQDGFFPGHGRGTSHGDIRGTCGF